MVKASKAQAAEAPPSDGVPAELLLASAKVDEPALRALLPGLPDTLGTTAQYFDIEHKEMFDEAARKADERPTQALLYLSPRYSDTLVVLCRAIRKDWSPPGQRWGALFGRGVHVLVLEDRSRRFYAAGVAAIGDSREANAEYIGKLKAALGCTKLYAVGSSAGGSGALVYGVQAKAEKILTFSAITAMREDFYETRDQTTPDSDRVVKRTGRLVRRITPEQRYDCREMLLAAEPKPQVRCHYPTALYWDRMWGEHLEGVPNVTTVPDKSAAGHSLLNDSFLASDDTDLARREIVEFLFDGVPGPKKN